MTDRPQPMPRSHYLWFCQQTTRWNDNDAFGHVSNSVYYNFIDTAVTMFLHEKAGLSLFAPDLTFMTMAAETRCVYFEPLYHPSTLDVGITFGHVGRSSLRYDVGIFVRGNDKPAAQGSLLHVHVDKLSGKSIPIPQVIASLIG
jgi:acyl-CoA thioester hydrolase